MAQTQEIKETIDLTTEQVVKRMKEFIALFESGQIEFEYLRTATIDHELRMLHIGYKFVGGSIH